MSKDKSMMIKCDDCPYLKSIETKLNSFSLPYGCIHPEIPDKTTYKNFSYKLIKNYWNIKGTPRWCPKKINK